LFLLLVFSCPAALSPKPRLVCVVQSVEDMHARLSRPDSMNPSTLRNALLYGAIAALVLACLRLLAWSPLWLDWGRELAAAAIALAGVAVGVALRLNPVRRPPAAADAPPAAESGADSSADWSARLATLTRRELEILTLLSDGLSNKALARELKVSENTVKTHLANLYAKLGVRRRVEAVLAARKLGLDHSSRSHPNFTRQGDAGSGATQESMSAPATRRSP
jgi:DNA-binding CsgD family transcriptional regulator